MEPHPSWIGGGGGRQNYGNKQENAISGMRRGNNKIKEMNCNERNRKYKLI
jgi:hypothetical protein